MNLPSQPVLRTTEDSGEPALQAAKWLQHPMLLDGSEMKSLLEELENPLIYRVGAVMKIGEERVAPETFLKEYKEYAGTLKRGELPNMARARSRFALVFTVGVEALFSYRLSPEEHLIRTAQPVIQLQAHFMHYSSHDNRFRSMVFGPDCITWGIQFSYPQIYQDAATKQIIKIEEETGCINTPLYRRLQRWQRKNTRPTPMDVDGMRINIPVRIGYRCMAWINRHPQLIEKNMRVFQKERDDSDDN